MQYNGFSNLELFWTKVKKVGFMQEGEIHSRLSEDLLKVEGRSGRYIHILNLVLTNHNKG